MPETTPLQPLAPWVALAAREADWDALAPGVLDTMLAQLHLIRAFEEEVLLLASQKLVNGPAHASIGQEAGAVGSCLPLVGADQINGSHRGHHQFRLVTAEAPAPQGLAKTDGEPQHLDAESPGDPEMTEFVHRHQHTACRQRVKSGNLRQQRNHNPGETQRKHQAYPHRYHTCPENRCDHKHCGDARERPEQCADPGGDVSAGK